MSEWRTIKDLGQVFDGPHATPKKTAEGPVYLGIDAIADDGSLLSEQFAHLSENDFSKWTKRVEPQVGDIVFSYEATLGRYAIIPENFRGCLGRRLGIVRPDEQHVNPKWLYYYFFTSQWKTFIGNHTFHGSTVDRISIEDFPNYPVLVSDRQTQDEIANLLGAVDDKIQSNQRICKELEDTIRLIYNYWFTQFDFPDENGNPYRSSGGKMRFVKELHQEVPSSWRIGTLNTLSEYATGKTDASHLTASNYISTDNMLPQRGGVTSSGYVPYEGKVTAYRVDDILLSNIRPYFKKIWQADISGGCCADVLAVHSKDTKYADYLYWTVEQDVFFKYMTAGSKGSKMPRGDKKHIMNYPMAIPPLSVVSDFRKYVLPIKHQLQISRKQNKQLSYLRDWLLPMLMNGQVKITESEFGA